MSRFMGKWSVEEFSPYMMVTLSELSYITKKGVIHSVPVGFKTDGASIPKIFWSWIGSPFTGLYRRPALIHDWLYYIQKTTRLYSDRVFLEAMQDNKVSFWKRRAMYIAVRSWGWIPWNRHIRLRSNNDNNF